MFCKNITKSSIEKDKVYSLPLDEFDGKLSINANLYGDMIDMQLRVYVDRCLTYYSIMTGSDVELSFNVKVAENSKISFVTNQDAVISFKIYNL